MTFGVTNTGINLPTIADIKTSMSNRVRELIGDQISTESNGIAGSLIDAFSIELGNSFQMLNDTYYSQFPFSAEGINLDNAVSYTNITRLGPAKSTVTGRIMGTLETIVPIGFSASVTDSPDSIFLTVESGTIGVGIDSIQTIEFSAFPTNGVFTLTHSGNETSDINYNDTSFDIETSLNALASLSGVIVTGDFSTGFTITFSGSDGQKDQALLIVSLNTLSDGSDISITVTETKKGYLPYVDIRMQSQENGPIVANSGSLLVIDTPTAGISDITNLSNAVIGRYSESDVELRIRREETLQTTQNGTDIGIKNKILNVDNVLQSKVTSNRTDTVINGVPGRSIEAIILGGDDVPIAEAIESARPCGISTFGSTSIDVADQEGQVVTINFSRPTEANIYFEINITENIDPTEGPLFPTDGIQQIKDQIISYATTISGIGEDVILNKFYTPINNVAGVIGIDIFLGTITPPTQQSNISIANNEIASFSESRITVNVL